MSDIHGVYDEDITYSVDDLCDVDDVPDVDSERKHHSLRDVLDVPGKIHTGGDVLDGVGKVRVVQDVHVLGNLLDLRNHHEVRNLHHV